MKKNSFWKNILSFLIILITTSNSSLAALSLDLEKDHTTQYLLIQSAGKSDLFFNEKDKSYQLDLKNLDKFIYYFSSSPDKVTGHINIKYFISCFDDEIKKSRPKGINAALVGFDKKNKKIMYMISLTKPAYDEERNVLHYTVRFLPGQQAFPTQATITLGHPVLFIDACAECGGSGF